MALTTSDALILLCVSSKEAGRCDLLALLWPSCVSRAGSPCEDGPFLWSDYFFRRPPGSHLGGQRDGACKFIWQGKQVVL